MSVQLILYPQNYDGTYSFTSTPILTQYVSDKNFAGGLVTVTGTYGSTPSHTVLQTYVPQNFWWGWYAAVGDYSGAAAPTTSASGLHLHSKSGGGLLVSSTGAFQLISNLTFAVCYEVNITISSGNASGFLYVGNQWSPSWSSAGVPMHNLGMQSFLVQQSTAQTLTFTFIAAATEEVIVLDYRANNGASITISEVSITECPASAPLSYSDLADGQVICDLYEEEAIPLSLSVDDFKNVAEKVQSYSKDFHLPNTKRNNKIFSHIFDVQRATDAFSFNPYLKTRAILKENSYTLFEGFLRLIDINDKEGEISYNVNLFSEAVTLADTLKLKDFNDLIFTELEHAYTKTNIENSWTGSLVLDNALPASSYAGSGTTTDVLKYPLVDWSSNKHLDASNVVQFDNIEDAFRPFLKLKYLIDRIISEAGFEYNSNFFDTADFNKLYMDMNWGSDIGVIVSGQDHLSFRWSNGSFFAASTWTKLYPTSIQVGGINVGYYGKFNTTNKRFEEDTDGTLYDVSFNITIENDTASSNNVLLRWVKTDTSTTTTQYLFVQNITIAGNGTYTYTGNFQTNLDNGDFLHAEGWCANPSVIREVAVWQWATVIRTTTGISFDNKIKNLRGELNQWEFLKGIFTMFNLIVIKEEEVLRIEPYADIFVRPIHALNTTAVPVKPVQHNWTDKVDISDINLKPLDLVKDIKFTYEDDEDDYSLNVYKKAMGGYLYGTKNFNGSTAVGSQVTILTGEEEIIATPFAPTIIKPIFLGYDNDFQIPVIYSGNEDGTEFEGFENAPRIMYDIQTVNLGTGKYSAPLISPVFNGKQEFRQFGHISTLPTTATTNDINFGECPMVANANTTIKNLFNEYYLPYYSELYHPDTRVMTLKVNLTPADIQNFNFYDTVLIKNREYRVNKIEYKPNTLAKVEFILIP